MLLIKTALLLCCCFMITPAHGYPVNAIETESPNGTEGLKVALLTHPLEDDSNIVLTLLDAKAANESPDDLELAEVNIFRPVFRYRVSVSKKVTPPPQF